jgi:hypothetical protein
VVGGNDHEAGLVDIQRIRIKKSLPPNSLRIFKFFDIPSVARALPCDGDGRTEEGRGGAAIDDWWVMGYAVGGSGVKSGTAKQWRCRRSNTGCGQRLAAAPK